MDADDLGCATPDQENCENSHDDHMYQAINRFIGTQEQSYEEFLGAFSCLTAGRPTSSGCVVETVACYDLYTVVYVKFSMAKL